MTSSVGCGAGADTVQEQVEDTTRRVEEVLRERLAAGVTIAMVTHRAAQAARLGHRHLRMERGRLVPA